jgi:hypothetical protein
MNEEDLERQSSIVKAELQVKAQTRDREAGRCHERVLRNDHIGEHNA